MFDKAFVNFNLGIIVKIALEGGIKKLKEKPKLYILQIYRGLAALMVLLHHGVIIMKNEQLGVINSIFEVGWVGVDFFFVLSGFIIFFTCNKLIGQKREIKKYAIKRIIRVFPFYWFITIGVLLLYQIINVNREFNLQQVINSFLLLPQEDIPIVSVSWSLVYEVFFYFMFGLLIYFNKKIGRVFLMLWVSIILLNSFNIFNMKEYLIIDVIFSNYNIEFLIGIIIAYYTLKYSIKSKISNVLLAVILIIFAWINVIEGNIIRGSTTSVIIFGSCFGLLILFSISLRINTEAIIPKILIVLGDASYSIYLTHVFIFGFLYQYAPLVNNFYPFTSFIILSVFTLFLGVCCFYLMEKPMLFFMRNKFIDVRSKVSITKNISKSTIQ